MYPYAFAWVLVSELYTPAQMKLGAMFASNGQISNTVPSFVFPRQ